MDCRISAEFERRLRNGADAGEIAREAERSWNVVITSLSPVLGVRGVASLSQRCILLASGRHPWLSDIAAIRVESGLGALLADALSLQTREAAASAATLLLTTLDELLTSLVGASLTGRLLQPVWSDLLRDTHTQGKTE